MDRGKGDIDCVFTLALLEDTRDLYICFCFAVTVECISFGRDLTLAHDMSSLYSQHRPPL